MKAMLAGAAREGTPTTIESAATDKATEVSDKTLGTLLQNYFLKAFLVNSSMNSNQVESAVTPAESQAIAAGLPYFKFQSQILMESEHFEQTRQSLLKLRDLRNEVVHHLLDRFDIDKESECLAATAYLDACYVSFNNHCLQLKEWATGMEKARARSASFMKTQMFEDLIANGINPDGTVNWPASGIVLALRDAEVACTKKGWILLDSAIAWVRTDYPDQTPAKYHCKTWKQVLQRSEQFEIRVAIEPLSNRGQTWFRSRLMA